MDGPGLTRIEPGATADSLRRIVVQAVVLVAVVIAVVGAAAVIINQRIAKQEAVHEVARTTDLLAESVVQPALTDAMAGSPATASAVLSARVARACEPRTSLA